MAREVYNGYEEFYMTGSEIKNHFKDAYPCYGRHHEKVAGYKMDFSKYYPKIKDDITYRLFINENFCKVMDKETDKEIYFFGYTLEKPKWAKE